MAKKMKTHLKEVNDKYRNSFLRHFTRMYQFTLHMLIGGLFSIIVAILVFFATEEYQFIKNCQAEGHSKEKCENIWLELELID